MKNGKKFFVANDDGIVAGHDLDYAEATIYLEEAEKEYPEENLEII